MQDPQNPDLRIYRVFDSIKDADGSVVETGHQVKGTARVSTNKAVRASLGAVLTQKAAVSRDPMQMQLALTDGASGEVGEPANKKARRVPKPRELTDADRQQKEFDTGMKKILILINCDRSTF